MRLVLFEADPPYQQHCELHRSWRLISLYGVNPLILTQPGWDSAWLCTGLPPAFSASTGPEQSSPKLVVENKLRCLGEVGPPQGAASICILMASAQEPEEWGSTGTRDSSLISLSFQKLAEAQVEGWGFRAGGVRGWAVGVSVCSGSGPWAAFQLLSLFPHKVKSKCPGLAFKAFPGTGWLTAKARRRCETPVDGALVWGRQLEIAGLCALVLQVETLRERDKGSCPKSQGLEAHQRMELTCLDCQSSSVLF